MEWRDSFGLSLALSLRELYKSIGHHRRQKSAFSQKESRSLPRALAQCSTHSLEPLLSRYSCITRGPSLDEEVGDGGGDDDVSPAARLSPSLLLLLPSLYALAAAISKYSCEPYLAPPPELHLLPLLLLLLPSCPR